MAIRRIRAPQPSGAPRASLLPHLRSCGHDVVRLPFLPRHKLHPEEADGRREVTPEGEARAEAFLARRMRPRDD
jgi:hypothetical protein